MNKKLIFALGLACIVQLGLTSVANAEREHGGHEGHGWHGDMRAFHEHDIERWHGGRWYKGRHGDHLGWWWIVGGVYYWYDRPVYPYPDPYVPPAVVVQQQPVMIEQAPPQMPPPSAPPSQPAQTPAQAAGTWYYCDSAKSYYPYIATCPGGWRAVAATPAPPH